mgnify:CR=1 FL=1
MQISTKGRYALRLMLDLAVHNTGELVKIKDISARENISEKYLEQIISMAISPTFCRCATRIGCGWRRWNCRARCGGVWSTTTMVRRSPTPSSGSIRSYSRRRKRGMTRVPFPSFFPSFSQNRKFFQSVIGYRHAL